MKDCNQVESLVNLFPEESRPLLTISGIELVQKIGLDVAKSIIIDVFCGRNLRDSTEMLTRRRLALLNAATVDMMLRGSAERANFIDQLPAMAKRILQQKKLSKAERWMAQWVLGLTDKASQNVLRDEASLLEEYCTRYSEVYGSVSRQSEHDFGKLNAPIYLGKQHIVDLNWKSMLYLMGMIGAQTLTIRGSEKSTYGKLFERLVLGSLLHILGFEYVDEDINYVENKFWLSSQAEKRESDATALWRLGKGARFDIGFIGRGNSEVSLDKVTRFEREIEMGRSTWYMATIVIIGKGSRLKELAQRVDGDIVQMSMAYWPQEVAQILNDRMDFKHELLHLSHSEIRPYLAEAMQNVPLSQFLPS